MPHLQLMASRNSEMCFWLLPGGTQTSATVRDLTGKHTHKHNAVLQNNYFYNNYNIIYEYHKQKTILYTIHITIIIVVQTNKFILIEFFLLLFYNV